MRFLFRKTLVQLGLKLPDKAEDALWLYWEALLARNQVLNLISSRQSPETQIVVHLVDSLTPLLLPELPTALTALDIGSGGGLPALPLALARPDWRYTLLEATGKKAAFLAEMLQVLALKTVTVENRFLEPVNREGMVYDLVTARAVSQLNRLADLAGPFLRPGGLFLAMKGPKGPEEVAEAAPVLRKRHLVLRRRLDLTLPLVEAARTLLLFQKNT